MLTRIDHISEHTTRYVIAINCSTGLPFTSIVPQLRRQFIECIDVISYDAVADFQSYLSNFELADKLPLLFIFSETEMLLVSSYQELVLAQSRLAA